MQKRGQLTAVLVLVVFVVTILGMTVYINSIVTEKRSETAVYIATAIPLDSAPVQEYVDSLLSYVTLSAVEVIGAHGGYISQQPDLSFGEQGFADYTIFEGKPVPYLIIDKDADGTIDQNEINTLPLENITERLRRYVAVKLTNYTNFTSLENRGYMVAKPNITYRNINFNFSKAVTSYSQQSVNVTVSALSKDVLFEVQYPILVSMREAKTEIMNFQVRLNVPLRNINTNVTNLISEFASNNRYSIDCEKYSAAKSVSVTKLDKNTTVIRFVAVVSPDYNYTFQFAVRNVTVEGGCPMTHPPCGHLYCCVDHDCGICRYCGVGGHCEYYPIGTDFNNQCPDKPCTEDNCDGAGACKVKQTPGHYGCGACKHCDGTSPECVNVANGPADPEDECTYCHDGACV